MAAKPESRFILSIHRRLDPAVYREKNANPFRGGTPDMYYEGDKAQLLVEYKWLPSIPSIVDLTNLNSPGHLSRLQQRWLQRCVSNGHRAGVLAGTPKGVLVFPGLEALTPHPRDFLQFHTPAQVAHWIHTQTCWGVPYTS